MSDNNIKKMTDQQTMTSLEIAEVTGRNHFDILKAIRKMQPAWDNVAASKFTCSYYKDKSGKRSPMFTLTKAQCLYVATKFNDEARAKLVLRWEQLEKEKLESQSSNLQKQQYSENESSVSNLPVDPRNLSRLQILQLALQAEEEKEQLQHKVDDLEADNYSLATDNAEKQQQITQLKEQTAYLSVIMADQTAVTVSQIAQDYGMGAKSFNNLLRGLNIQRKVGDQWILYSAYLGRGYVQTRMIPIHHSDRPDTYKPVTVWTQSGRKFIYDQLKKHGTLPGGRHFNCVKAKTIEV
jgi:phage regulator Rha-like protein/phage antirepressor YoqD-like protein